MSFEPTSDNNYYMLTKKQHFHLKAILKRFTSNNLLQVNFKGAETKSFGVKGKCFLGNRAWSQECESLVSHPIEEKFLTEVKRIESGNSISDHEAISHYHLLWYLRWQYSINEAEDSQLFNNVPCVTLDKNTEELIESLGKVPVRSGGKIAGRFTATQEIKKLLTDNKDLYSGYQWQVLESNGEKFISADCNGNSMGMAISPKYYLRAVKNIEEEHRVINNAEVHEINRKSIEIAQNFYFGCNES
ncbi:hypothetical protein Patl_0675 [Paraglaciecola sp. T6c]|uniref:hypothetical protein n=1 Tax=Pseudoalteromonas atlantica (strain T6c / ATCC BAA-1087) TaxID=3042615 RepID=UPI00005C6716|nr:hypothetical protein [Paraglaciecola sp. T6c]ABG39203.1 hypothetical protein Patl_0675 [Paraglaciecola sp. T6c]